LQKAGVKALQSKDYRTAIDLLKRAVDADMSVKDAWYDLGQAYAGANHHAEAIAAFRKQIELDPNHNAPTATWPWNCNKPASPTTQSRPSASNGDNSLRQDNAKNLGLLLSQLGKDADARAELEASVALPPDDPETKMALAQVYDRLGEKSKAQE